MKSIAEFAWTEQTWKHGIDGERTLDLLYRGVKIGEAGTVTEGVSGRYCWVAESDEFRIPRKHSILDDGKVYDSLHEAQLACEAYVIKAIDLLK